MDTVIVLAVIVAIVAVATLVLLGMRRGGGAVVAPGDEARLQSAFPYEGMIVGFEEVGDGRDGRGAFRTIDFAFEIQPPGEAPYQTRTSWKVYLRSAHALQLGRTVPIKVDIDDPLIVYPAMPGVEFHWARAEAMQRRP